MLHELVVPDTAAGQRLDVWLTAMVEGCTRSLISRLIADGRCAVLAPGGRELAAKAGLALRGGETVALEVPEAEPMSAEPEDIPLRVLHEDAHLIAIDKPPGMVVHPAIGHARGTLVNAVLGRWRDQRDAGGEAWRPGVVHRLDADTSGVIVIARTAAALAALQTAFRERAVRKRYLALLAGSPAGDLLRCQGHIGRHPRDVRRRAVLPAGSGDAREAETIILIGERRAGYCVAECRPRTGRTHQIRVHAAHAGHPVLADPLYGRSATWPLSPGADGPVLRRHALHAWELELPHPAGGRLTLRAPIPDDLRAFAGDPVAKAW